MTDIPSIPPRPFDEKGAHERPFATQLAIAFITGKRDLSVRFNGQIVSSKGATASVNYRDETLTLPQLLQEFLLDPAVRALQTDTDKPAVTSTTLRYGFHRAVDILKHERYLSVVDNLNRPLGLSDKADARKAFRRCIEASIDTDPDIAEAVVLQWIQNAKRSAMDLPINRPLFVVIGGTQAAGKSRFVEKLLAPTEELSSKPISLHELTGQPHASIFSYMAINVDDTDPVRNARQIAGLKRLITNPQISTRILRTSMDTTIRKRAQFIGSSNFDLSYLFNDPTGLRRFVLLPYRNGDVDRGGDPRVWQAVDETDFMKVWRSVDVDEPSFVEPIWGRLASYQQANHLQDGPKEWLERLDVRSDPVVAITVHGWIRVSRLYELFQLQTGNEELKVNAFGRHLRKLEGTTTFPFSRYRQVRAGSEYLVKGWGAE